VPRAQIASDRAAPSDVVPHDLPVQGEASYWSANVGGQTHDGIVWAYEAPISAAVEIAGFLSFYPNRTEVTVDGEVLTA
jgi:uncharacterized protein (DUF427 family)